MNEDVEIEISDEHILLAIDSFIKEHFSCASHDRFIREIKAVTFETCPPTRLEIMQAAGEAVVNEAILKILEQQIKDNKNVKM